MRGTSAKPGDTRVSQNGYSYTRTENKWRLTHHIVAEEKILHRDLKENERVTFVDGDRSNLDHSNLQVKMKGSTNWEKRLAQLEARRDELDAEINYVKSQLNNE